MTESSGRSFVASRGLPAPGPAARWRRARSEAECRSPLPVRRTAWLAALLFLAACGGGDAGGPPEPTCSVHYDGSYEPSTQSPDPAAAC